jgi:D-arabinose 1-dehydrogenase-like Zn-dependent alcohol dehydrogenase
MVGRHGGFSDRLRVQWAWARPLPDGLDLAKTGPLLCGGNTVFAPFLQQNIPSTARVGVIGIGGLGHMALQFANKWGCEVHAFTTSDSKEKEARLLGAITSITRSTMAFSRRLPALSISSYCYQRTDRCSWSARDARGEWTHFMLLEWS